MATDDLTARVAELESEVAAFRKSNEDWRDTAGEAHAEAEAERLQARSWESNYNALRAENAHLRSRMTEGLVCPTCKHDFAASPEDAVAAAETTAPGRVDVSRAPRSARCVGGAE